MSYPRASAVLSGVLLATITAISSGCGKSQPSVNQAAATTADPSSVSTGSSNLGTAVYQPHADLSPTAPPPVAASAASPPAAAGSSMPGPTVAGSAVSGPTVAGSAVSGPTVAQAASPPTTAPSAPQVTAAPASGNTPALAQPNAATTASGAAVASGNVAGLAAAVNQWRMQGSNLVGVKRLDDKPVVAGYSWMTHLLPYLGHGDLYGKIDFTKGWHDPVNLQQTGQLIPAFIDPSNPNHHMAVIGGKKGEVGPAFTHFVGMAGVEDSRNLVAAALPRSDPRAGIFGYDQIARAEEITDGGSNTIMLIAAGKIVGPWASGGGATIRGARAPYFDSITGFGSVGDPGGGALVAMADGSVKRISKDIDPAVFRALCTIHGGETIDLTANANVIRSQ